jgi:hypothetical protein
MLSTLLPETSDQITVGSVLELANESYLIVTRTFQEKDQLKSNMEENEFRDLNRFKILSFQSNVFAITRYVGVVKVDRVEIAALLRILEDQLMVRFEGEYTTKELPLSRFKNTGEKLVIRDESNKLVGIYHDSSGTFLISPDEDNPKESGVQPLDESIFRRGTIKSPTHNNQKESASGTTASKTLAPEPFQSFMDTARRYLMTDSRR